MVGLRCFPPEQPDAETSHRTAKVSPIALKDRTIQELQRELERLRAERTAAEERARLLEEEKAKLETELLELQSQGRIHNLSLGNLQDKLTRAYAEREELARKLRLAEEALKEKVCKGGRGIEYCIARLYSD